MQLLVKLKETLTELSEAEPEYLKEGVIACASKCDEVLQKFKAETERELESRDARIESLTSELTLYRELFQGMYWVNVLNEYKEQDARFFFTVSQL